jgi:penicillin-binding protein 1C
MDILSDAEARRAVFGADLPLDLPFKAAAKTGTSSGFADTVAVGVTREAVAAAWAGNFDGSGSKGALAMWSAAPLVRAALLAVAGLAGHPLTLPAPPSAITSGDVCRISGALAGPQCPRKHEHFIAGHEPQSICDGKHHGPSA